MDSVFLVCGVAALVVMAVIAAVGYLFFRGLGNSPRF